jgi:hypothetical protein
MGRSKEGAMTVWNIDSIEKTLTDWAVFEVPLHGQDQPWTRHFAGWSCEDAQGQVGSAIRAFDPATGACVTKSGRVYRLRGRPGLSADAEYVWNRWRGIAGITEQRDVTLEVLEAITAASRSSEGTPGERS